MKASELIKRIQDDMEVYGDVEIFSYKIVDENMTTETYMYSPTRMTPKGNRARMNRKEMKQYLIDKKEANDGE